MAAQKLTIEFLPQEDWERSGFGKVLKWALTVGRYIVVFTELIVILAFLSRFKLDRDLNDLGEKIKSQQAIIESFSKFEEEFRFLSKRLETVENLQKTRLAGNEILNEIVSFVPPEVALYDLEISKDKISLKASSLSEAGLGSFINGLKSSSKFKNLSLDQVESGKREVLGISFQLKGEIVQEK